MPLWLKVREVMVPAGEFPAVYDDADIISVFRILHEHFQRKEGEGTWAGFQSALVYNRQGRALGILTLRGLLRALQLQDLLESLLKSDPAGLFFLPGCWQRQFIAVREVMRPIGVAYVQEDAALWEAVLVMLKKKVNSVPVLSGDELCGVVRIIDIFWLIGEILDDMAN